MTWAMKVFKHQHQSCAVPACTPGVPRMSKKHEQSATFHISTSRLADAHLRVCPGYSFSLDGLYFEGNRRAKPSPEYGTNLDMAKSLSVICGNAIQSGMMAMKE